SAIGASLRNLHYGRFDSCICSAAAKIASQTILQIVGTRMWVTIEKCFARNHETGSAVAALLCVIIDKRLLHGMQFVALHQTFDGRYRFALGFDCQHRARVHSLAVHDHGAGTTGGAVTYTLCSS